MKCRASTLMENAIVLVIRIVAGLLLVSSSMSKIRYPHQFLADVYKYELFGPAVGLWVALLIPWLELLLGIALLSGIFLGGALLGTSFLAAGFAFVNSSALFRSLDISCGCFSTLGGEAVSYKTLVRALGLCIGAIIGYVCYIAGRRRVINAVLMKPLDG